MTTEFQVNSYDFDIHKCVNINGKSYCKDQVTIRINDYDMLELIKKFAWQLQAKREEKFPITLCGYLEHTASCFLDIEDEYVEDSEDDPLDLIAAHNYSIPLTLSLLYTQLLAFSIAKEIRGDIGAAAYMTYKSVMWAEIIDTVLQENAKVSNES